MTVSTQGDGRNDLSRPLRQPRLADMVAAVLRERIVGGDMEPGETLPKQEELLAEFQVSLPSLREAMRILESEGLLTVRRGKTGGALVHGPRAQNAAHMLGLVLQSRQVQLDDLAVALRALEPACAVLCSQREDRVEVVVEPLERLHEATLDHLDDPVEFTRSSRKFHEKMIDACGNQTLILVIGALDHLWSSKEETWEKFARARAADADRDVRERGVQAHVTIIEAIREGQSERVHQIVSEHLEHSVYYHAEGEAAIRAV